MEETQEEARPVAIFEDVRQLAQDSANQLFQPVKLIWRVKNSHRCVLCNGTKLALPFRIVIQRTAVAMLCDNCTPALASAISLNRTMLLLEQLHEKGKIAGKTVTPTENSLIVWIRRELGKEQVGPGGRRKEA